MHCNKLKKKFFSSKSYSVYLPCPWSRNNFSLASNVGVALMPKRAQPQLWRKTRKSNHITISYALTIILSMEISTYA